MGKSERSRAETQAHNISSRQKANRGGCTGTLGEVKGAAEVDCVGPLDRLMMFG
jgi:hypothetical protein